MRVITYGTFDLFHDGHRRLLERARALGDHLIVAVTTENFDDARGKLNVQQSLMDRIQNVQESGLADEVIIEEYEGQKINDIQKHHVDIFAIGSDWLGKFDYLKDYCEVVYLERTKGISSTQLRNEKRHDAARRRRHRTHRQPLRRRGALRERCRRRGRLVARPGQRQDLRRPARPRPGRRLVRGAPRRGRLRLRRHAARHPRRVRPRRHRARQARAVREAHDAHRGRLRTAAGGGREGRRRAARGGQDRVLAGIPASGRRGPQRFDR